MGSGISLIKRAGWSLIQADARALPLADESVQCVCTSPPFWGLRDYGFEDQLGLEKTPEEYIDAMVGVFRELRRVLRKDGTVFLNLGDSYNAKPNQRSNHDLAGWKQATNIGSRSAPSRCVSTLKPKDQCLIPHRVALALQADGWWVRDTIIWHKPNPMPSSVTDRTTTAHEYLFLLTKSSRYYYDADAIREPITSTGGAVFGGAVKGAALQAQGIRIQGRRVEDPAERNHPLGRNKRSVWTIATQSFHGAHFATFPVKLIEPCILAGTSEKGCCPKCGACWRRVVERVATDKMQKMTDGWDTGPGGHGSFHRDGREQGKKQVPVMASVTINWLPSCKCHAGDPIPCTVLDIFNGAATTGIAAMKHGRRYIGIDRKAEYLEMSRKRLTEYKERPQKRPRKQPTSSQGVLGFGEGGQL